MFDLSAIKTSIDNNRTAPSGMKPLHFVPSLLYFVLPALMMFFGMHIAYPYMLGVGLTQFEAFAVTNTVPLAVLFAVGIALSAQESGAEGLAQRLRLKPFSWRYVLYGVIAFAVLMFVSGFFMVPQQMMVEAGVIPVPAEVPLIHAPNPDLSSASLSVLVGGEIAGNWGIVILYAIMFFFNIVGEELYWRGHILPRQELAHGRWTWLIHGTMWCLFHSFKWWSLIGLLPVCLLTAWIAQRTKSTIPGLVTHALFNIFPLIIIILAVLDIA